MSHHEGPCPTETVSCFRCRAMVCLCQSGIKVWVCAIWQPQVSPTGMCFGNLIRRNKSMCPLMHAGAHKKWDLQIMLSPKTMWPECCRMPVDASCWSINMVWSLISKSNMPTLCGCSRGAQGFLLVDERVTNWNVVWGLHSPKQKHVSLTLQEHTKIGSSSNAPS